MEKLKKALDVVDQEVAEMRKRFVYHCFINLSKTTFLLRLPGSKNTQLHGLDRHAGTKRRHSNLMNSRLSLHTYQSFMLKNIMALNVLKLSRLFIFSCTSIIYECGSTFCITFVQVRTTNTGSDTA